MTLSDWLTKIADIHVSAIDLGLQRILPLAAQLKLTRFNVPVVMVGGTNGKGSVIATLESIYTAAGYNVAAYTSPHLRVFNERLRYQKKSVADEQWIAAFERIETLRLNAGITLSFFEFTTLAVLLMISEMACDVILLEVGLGGRLDAVNVVEADVAVITNVDIDHVQWLGSNREDIGCEKAGIFRRKQKVVCGDPDPPNSVLQQAEELQVDLYRYQQQYRDVDRGEYWDWQGPSKTFTNLPSSKLKLQNLATALMVTSLLDLSLPPHAFLAGITETNLPGRYQFHQAHCAVILDVAHNPQSAIFLAERVTAEKQKYDRVHAVVGMLADKDIGASLASFMPIVETWCLASLSVERGATAAKIAEFISSKNSNNCYNFESVAEALEHALGLANPHDLVLVFGSFHTVADALVYLEGKHAKAY